MGGNGGESPVSVGKSHPYEKVHFGGYAQTPEQIWRDHHALLLTSRCEGNSLAVAESIAYLKRLDEIVDEIGMETIAGLLRENDGAKTLRVINQHVLGTK